MNLPDKCPFCDAGPGQYVNNYLCGTFMRPNVASRVHQTKVCLVSERARLSTRVAELEARCKRMEEAGDEMFEAIYTPEPPRCMCSRSHPCDDCVNYSSARDAKQKWRQAKEAKP